jgi:hypothetical protein
MHKEQRFTKEQFLEIIEYYPDTGLFFFKERPGIRNFNARFKDKPAGHLNPVGYIVIGIFGSSFLAHRLAFFLMMGRWPKPECDHINRIRSDNRWENLREVTHVDNMMNSWPLKGNLTGATFSKQHGKWFSRICMDGKSKFLGLCDTAEEAHKLWAEADKERAAKRIYAE